MPNSPNNEPYGFSISYSQSVANLYTILSGRKLVPKKNAAGDPLPGEYDEIEIPNSYPMLTHEGAVRVRAILEINMDKFNPIANLRDSDCAEAAAQTERSIAAEITLNADRYIYDFESDAASKLVVWDAFLKNLTYSLYRFATLARNGHFINFAGKIMSSSFDHPQTDQEQNSPLRKLFQRPRRSSEMTSTEGY